MSLNLPLVSGVGWFLLCMMDQWLSVELCLSRLSQSFFIIWFSVVCSTVYITFQVQCSVECEVLLLKVICGLWHLSTAFTVEHCACHTLTVLLTCE